MNYEQSKINISPVHNDTPCLLSKLRHQLQVRTDHEIPYFLMPVRMETRFMRDQPTSLLPVDCLFSPVVIDTSVLMSGTLVLMTGYSGFKAFTSATTLIAAETVHASFSEAMAFMTAHIDDLDEINPAEKDKLTNDVKSLGKQKATFDDWLINYCEDPNILVELEGVIADSTAVLDAMVNTVAGFTLTNDWEQNVSQNTTATWVELTTILDNNATYQANYIVGGVLDEVIFGDFINSCRNTLELFAVVAENDYDVLYVWTLLPPLRDQLAQAYQDLQNVQQPDPANALLSLYTVNVQLQEAWEQYAFPGKAKQRLRPVSNGDQILEYTNKDLAPILKGATAIEEKVAQATTYFDEIKDALIDSGAVRYDLDEVFLAMMDAGGGNRIAGSNIEKMVEALANYETKISEIITELDELTLDSHKRTVYVWQKLKPLNKQFAALYDIVSALPYPEGAEEEVAAIASAITAFTFPLAFSWDHAVLGADMGVLVTFGTTTTNDHLWIRVYPDEIFISTFEPGLTPDEIAAGTTYWTAVWDAHGNPTELLAAWQALVALYGPERAAWIRQALTPTNIGDLCISPAYMVMESMELMTAYTGELIDLTISDSEIAADHIAFMMPQLESATTTTASIQALPQETYVALNARVSAASAKFDDLRSLGNMKVSLDAQKQNVQNQNQQLNEAAAIDSMGAFAAMMEDLSASYVTLGATAAAIPTSTWGTICPTSPIFPTPPTAGSSWSEAPCSKVMPDRFLFAAIKNGSNNIADPLFGSHIFKHIAIGKKIPNPLYTGLKPTMNSFTVDLANNELVIDPSIKWMFDFTEALNKGMAIALRLDSEEAAIGFDKVLALGVRVDEDLSDAVATPTYLKNQGQTLLQNLLDGHHYTTGGMSILEIGTATNNTDDSTSGFNQKDANDLSTFAAYAGPNLFTSTYNIEMKADGQWLADALGINYSTFYHVANAGKFQIRNAISMNRAMWGGTIGSYMREMMNTLFTDDNIARSKDYFTDYVLGRGALPSIRVRQQPYGILPVTSFGRWDWTKKYTATTFPAGLRRPSPPNAGVGTYSLWDYATDAVASTPPVVAGIGSANIDKFLQDRYNIRVYNVLKELNNLWIEISAWNTKTVDKNLGGSVDRQSDFMYMLGTDALMAEAQVKYFVNARKLPGTFERLTELGQGILSLPMTSPPSIIDDFKNLFSSFFSPPGILSSPPPLGDNHGLFDTLDFFNIQEIFDDVSSYFYSPPGTTTERLTTRAPTPQYQRMLNALRMFNVHFVGSAKAYKLTGPTVTEMPLSKTTGLPAISGADNYIKWLSRNTTTLQAIWKNNVFSTMPSRGLLYLLLRQSVLSTYRDSAFDILEGLVRANNPIITSAPSIFSKNMRKYLGSPESKALEMSIGIDFQDLPLNKWYFLFQPVANVFSGAYTISSAFTSPPSTPSLYNFTDESNLFNTYNSDPGDYYNATIANGYTRSNPAGDPRRNTINPSGLGWATSPLSDFLRNPPSVITDPDLNLRTDINTNIQHNVNVMNRALNTLSGLPTAELDTLLREHIDLCSYRLDAWNYGMVNKRLWETRNTDTKNSAAPPPGRKLGIYLGAYGWLLNVRPSGVAANVVSPPTMPTGLTTTGTGNVHYDPTNLGFIHTPSITHALTAAVLRSGYVSEKSDSDNRFAVNLSSERVTLAVQLLEGIRNGQSLDALLGYMFEKNMHDRYTLPPVGVEMDKYIYYLRRKFPLDDPGKITNNTHPSPPLFAAHSTTYSPPFNMRPTNVVDGVALIEKFRSVLNTGLEQHPQRSIYEFAIDSPPSFSALYAIGSAAYATLLTSLGAGPTDMPVWGTSQCRALFAEVDRVANAIDALGDLMLAEGVFQAAKGNFQRSAATVEALTEGKNPVSPQILETPASGVSVHHRLGAMIDTEFSFSYSPPASFLSPPVGYAGSVWSGMDPTYRSLAEPNINNWIGKLLYAQINNSITISNYPTKIACTASYLSGGLLVPVQVTLADLNIQPIDLLYLAQSGSYTSEMNKRIAYHVKAGASLSADTEIKIDYADMGSSMEGSFQQILTVLNSVSDILGASRWMKAADFTNHGTTIASPPVAQYDLTELQNRYTALYSELHDLNDPAKFPTALSMGFTLDDLRNNLFFAAYMGVGYAIPDSANETIAVPDWVNKLLALGRKVLKDIAARDLAAVAATTFAGSATEDEKVAGYIKGIAIVLGSSFKAIPHFGFDNYPLLEASIYNQIDAQVNVFSPPAPPPASPPAGNLMAYYIGQDLDLVLDEWLYGIARVQERVDNVETVRLFSRTENDHPLKQFRPVQFPFSSSDYWLGLEYPGTYGPTEDRFSVALFNWGVIPSPPATDKYCGLIIDEWTEVIPFTDQTTGVTFNYAQPTAKPPQNVLLAVNPQKTGVAAPWKLEDLIHTLLDTIDMAQIRMVDTEDFIQPSIITSPPTPPAMPAKSPFTGVAPTTVEKDRTRKFQILKWMLPAIVGEITPIDRHGQYQGNGSVQGVSFDYFTNNASPPTYVPTPTTGGGGGAGVPSGPPSFMPAPPGGGGPSSGIPSLDSLSSEELLTSPAVHAYVRRQESLSHIAHLQDRLTQLTSEV